VGMTFCVLAEDRVAVFKWRKLERPTKELISPVSREVTVQLSDHKGQEVAARGVSHFRRAEAFCLSLPRHSSTKRPPVSVSSRMCAVVGMMFLRTQFHRKTEAFDMTNPPDHTA
jgi:hypothetical protein